MSTQPMPESPSEQRPSVLIGTPSYDGTVTLNYMRSVLEMINFCNTVGIRTGFQPLAYESLITRARNYIANEFLRQPEYTHLFFIDADIGFPAESIIRYVRSGKDVVCGIYPVKHLDVSKLRRLPGNVPTPEAVAASMTYTVKFKPGAQVDPEGLVQVEYAPTGFMMIKRRVLERMAEAMPELLYRNAFINTARTDEDNHAFFDTAIDPENRDYLPEDYAFCKRWRSLGGEIYADVLSRFIHAGNCDYQGDYPAFLKHFKADVHFVPSDEAADSDGQ